jgi:Tol biopolymer transport system component
VVGDWRSARVAPGTSQSGWQQQQQTGRMPASSPTTRGNGAGSPAWSPDGRSIAFDSWDGGDQVHIWTIDAEGGTPRQVTTGPGSQAVPRWSRDGRWIYFSSHQNGARDIRRVGATDGQPAQVTRTGSGFLGYEVEDGTSLLYQPVNGDSALLLQPLTGTTAPSSSWTASDQRPSLQLDARSYTWPAIRVRGRRFA